MAFARSRAVEQIRGWWESVTMIQPMKPTVEPTTEVETVSQSDGKTDKTYIPKCGLCDSQHTTGEHEDDVRSEFVARPRVTADDDGSGVKGCTHSFANSPWERIWCTSQEGHDRLESNVIGELLDHGNAKRKLYWNEDSEFAIPGHPIETVMDGEDTTITEFPTSATLSYVSLHTADGKELFRQPINKAVGAGSSVTFDMSALSFIDDIGTYRFPEGHGEEEDEAVDHPAHYGGADNPYEAIKVIEAWGLGFALGNAVKYISRAGKKDGASEVQDLEKTMWYVARRIQQLMEKES
jgi:hypothetical protein